MNALANCSQCGQSIQIGDYPFCPHGPIREASARRFDPIVVHRNAQTGEYSFPSQANDPVQPGYEKVEITNLRQADAFCQEVEARETAKRQLNIAGERVYWDQRTKQRREAIQVEMERRGIKASRLSEAVRQFVDQRREEKYSRLMRRPVNFNINVLSFDSSNREPHAGPETGWKDRKA